MRSRVALFKAEQQRQAAQQQQADQQQLGATSDEDDDFPEVCFDTGWLQSVTACHVKCAQCPAVQPVATASLLASETMHALMSAKG